MKHNIFTKKQINYKDFLIIIFAWYLITLSSYQLSEINFASLKYINDILSFSINVLSHAIFLLIIYSYFTLLYDFKLSDLGFNINKINIKYKHLLVIFLVLITGVLVINFNSQIENNNSFFPLDLGSNFLKIIYSDLPLVIFIFLLLLITSSVLQFLFNKIIFSLFDLYLPRFLAVIFTALFAPLLLLEFNPAMISIIFLFVIISNYLYIISNYNLISPTIFSSYFLTLYIVFIYGFDFILIKI